MKNFKSESLQPCFDTFRWNMIRTSNFLFLPAWIAFEAAREQLWIDYARVKHGGTINPDLAAYTSTEESEAMAAEFEKLARAFRNTPAEDMQKLLDDIGIGFVEHHIAFERKTISEGLKSMYCSVIIDSWAAFEQLVRELWITVLDQKPDIAQKVYLSKTLRDPNKKVEPKFNIISNYGSAVVELGQASFQTLRDIHTFYDAAFGDEPSDLIDKIEDGYVAVLNAYRNAIIHNRARADAMFRQQAHKFQEFNQLPDGTDLPLEGKSVTRMRTTAMELGREFIQMADRAICA